MQANEKTIQMFKRRTMKYHNLMENKLQEAGIEGEEDLLKYLCDNYLIDKIPDDYDGFMEKVKDKLRVLNDSQQFSDRNTVKTAM